MTGMRRPTGLVAAVGVAVLALTGCGPADGGDEADEPQPVPAEPEVEPPIVMEAALGVTASAAIMAPEACIGWGDGEGFNDPSQVVVLDATGTVRATARLSEAEILGDQLGCVKRAALEVPAGGQFYTVVIDDFSSEVIAEEDLGSEPVILLVNH